MGPDTIKHIAPFLIPIMALLIPIVAIVASQVSRTKRELALHETIRQLTANGQPVPPQLLDGSAFQFDDGRRTRQASPNQQLLFGAVNVGIGLGLVAMFFTMNPSAWLWSIGLLPIGVGLALLLVWSYEKRHPNA